MTSASSVPLTLLTGFLGAGKTTLLNRALARQHHRRVGVIVNELGRIDIDGKLLKGRAGDLVELAGGCVCHEARTQDELWDAIDELLARSRVDRIVLETTGIAEPAAVVDALGDLPADRRHAMVDQIVTVVDAAAALAQLDRHDECRAQVQAAHAVILGKLDLAAPAALSRLHARLAALNPTAERVAFPDDDQGNLALAAYLFDPRARAASPPRAHDDARDHAHRRRGPPDRAHHHQLAAVGITEDAPLLAEPLLRLCRELGDDLVRAKGFVLLHGEERRGYLERAGARLELRLLDPWPAGPRRSELVFIGVGLDPDRLRRQVWAARAGGRA